MRFGFGKTGLMHMSTGRTIGAAVAAGALAFAGCSGAPPVATPDSGPASVTTATQAASMPGPETECPPPAMLSWSDGTLADGRHFGWVRHFDGLAIYLDQAEYFGGEEAAEAALEDGEISRDDELPNPFHIRDPDPGVLRVAVSDRLAVTAIDSTDYPSVRELDVAAFARLFCPGADAAWMYSPPDALPVHLEVSANRVVSANEQYLP